MMKSSLICLAASTAIGACSPAIAGNLVVNGGFETGDFTGWTANAVSYPMYIVTSPVEEGTYAAQIAGYSYRPDVLSQTLTTTSGQGYTLSFWRYQQNVGPVTEVNVTWDGATIFSETLTGPGDVSYQQFTAHVVGTGLDTLAFTAANDPGWTYVDNISVAIPEPATWAMALAGFAALGFAAFRSRGAAVPHCL